MNESTEMKKKTNWLYLFAMILVLILAAVSYKSSLYPEENPGLKGAPTGQSPVGGDPSDKTRELEEKFRQKVLQEEIKYQQKNNELYNDFESKLQEIINRNFDAAENAIPSVVKDLSGFGACNKLCYKMAKDKIKGTSDAQDAIETAINKVLDHCSAGTAEVDSLLKDYEIRLAENSNQFRASIAEDLNNPEYISLDTSAIKKIAQDINAIHSSVYQNVTCTVAAEVGAAIELLLIRTTCQTLTSIFAKTVAKMAGSATAGVVCAAADGPLPVGDVIGGTIALAGLAWTAWDIRQAMTVIPDKLDRQLRDSVADYRSGINKSAKEQAQKLLEEYRKSTKELVNEVSGQ